MVRALLALLQQRRTAELASEAEVGELARRTQTQHKFSSVHVAALLGCSVAQVRRLLSLRAALGVPHPPCLVFGNDALFF